MISQARWKEETKMQNIEQNGIVTGLLRRKYIQHFYAFVAIIVVALERTADRYFSPYYIKFLDSLKSEPAEIRLMKQKITLIIILGIFITICSFIAFLFIRVGRKIKKTTTYPYAGKFCLFDTPQLEEYQAVKKGNQYILTGVICLALMIAMLWQMNIIFNINEFLEK